MNVPIALTRPVLQYHQPIGDLLDAKGREVHSIAGDASVHQAISVMSEKGIGCLVVVDKEGKLAGILSERDYARKVILMGRSSRGTRVREIMVSDVVTVGPETTIEAAMQLMTARCFRHLPVLNGDAIAGLVSIGDLVNWMLNSQQQAIRDLRNKLAEAG